MIQGEGPYLIVRHRHYKIGLEPLLQEFIELEDRLTSENTSTATVIIDLGAEKVIKSRDGFTNVDELLQKYTGRYV